MSFTVEKKDGKLIFNDHGGFQSRNPSTFWCIQQADNKYKWKDFTQITIYTNDSEDNISFYSYSKRNTTFRLVPDFNFHCWLESKMPDYDLMVSQIMEASEEIPKIDKVGWIGCVTWKRQRLFDIGQQRKDIFDILNMEWLVNAPRENGITYQTSKFISISDLVRNYKILIDIEGAGYSGRLKFLMWSKRPLIIIDREYKEWFFDFMIPWIHYIPVKHDLSDLVEKTLWINNNYELALNIAQNAFGFANIYLSRDACYEKWNEIISEYLIEK